MGSHKSEQGHDNDEAQHEVTLTQGFWIAETQTTQELWQTIMGNNPSCFKASNQLPVETVSWNDCQVFIVALNSSLNCILPGGYKYALPTEAQWEYACRAGTRKPFSFGSTLNGDKANCDGRYPYGTSQKGKHQDWTTPVKSYAPNAWGLYDMHGNVWEWCADRYGRDYYTNSKAGMDPIGAESGTSRVLRGGSWNNGAKDCGSAFRNANLPVNRSHNCGLRLGARILPPRRSL